MGPPGSAPCRSVPVQPVELLGYTVAAAGLSTTVDTYRGGGYYQLPRSTAAAVSTTSVVMTSDFWASLETTPPLSMPL